VHSGPATIRSASDGKGYVGRVSPRRQGGRPCDSFDYPSGQSPLLL
jgi:hypothetical protein